jgi:hypothetical protein
MAYPVGSDLSAFLLNRGLSPEATDEVDLDVIMEDVVAQWEADTGWFPFLYSGTVETRKYTGNGSAEIFLNAGICSLTGLVMVVGGDTLTIDETWWLRPADALVKGHPWTWIQYDFSVGTLPDDVDITARWGYCETLPESVKSALLRKGAAEWLRDHDNTTLPATGAAKRVKQGMREIELGDTGTGEYDGTLQAQFGRAYDRAVSRYQAPWKVLA